LSACANLHHLPPFPTRRSSDLLVQHDGLVQVPLGFSIPPDADRDAVQARLSATFGDPVEEPLLLKPALEGSSKGIRANCIAHTIDRKSTRLNSSHVASSYAVFG